MESSFKFEEEPFQVFQLEEGDSSNSPPLLDDVSDDSNEFSDSNFDFEEYEHQNSDIHHPKRKKQVEMTIYATGYLVDNPQDTRKTRSQFRNAQCVFVAHDPYILERCF